MSGKLIVSVSGIGERTLADVDAFCAQMDERSVPVSLLVVALAGAIRKLLRALPRSHPLWGPAWALALSVLLAAVWLNDNPLYGGQIETVITAIMIGLLAGIARVFAAEQRGAR